MAVDITGAPERARELFNEGESKAETVTILNNEFEATFYATTSGIYAVNNPDYAPAIEVFMWRG